MPTPRLINWTANRLGTIDDVAQIIPKLDIGLIFQQQLERLPGAAPDDMKDRRFTGRIGMIHRNAGLDTIAQFFQVAKTRGPGDGIRVLAGGKQRNPRQAKCESIKRM